MTEQNFTDISRRSFLKKSTAVSAATTFTIIKPELVRGAGDEKLKIGLIGCGGRGTEAAQQTLYGNENVELVAMGDVFEDHLEKSLDQIRNSKKYPSIARQSEGRSRAPLRRLRRLQEGDRFRH